MEWYFIVLLVLAMLILLGFLPIRVGMNMYWNVGKNLGVLCFSIWGIVVSCMQIEITQTAINIIKSKKQERQIQLQSLSFGAIFLHHLIQAIFRYTIIREVSIFCDISKKQDAFFTALANGIALQILYSCYAVLYGLKGNFRSFVSVNNNILQNKICLADSVSIFVSPAILLVSVVRAFLRTKRGIGKYERYAK